MDKESVEFLWNWGRLSELPLLELVQEVPGPRADRAWEELTRRERAWRACGDRVAELESAIRAAYDDMRDACAEYPSTPFQVLMELVPEREDV